MLLSSEDPVGGVDASVCDSPSSGWVDLFGAAALKLRQQHSSKTPVEISDCRILMHDFSLIISCYYLLALLLNFFYKLLKNFNNFVSSQDRQPRCSFDTATQS